MAYFHVRQDSGDYCVYLSGTGELLRGVRLLRAPLSEGLLSRLELFPTCNKAVPGTGHAVSVNHTTLFFPTSMMPTTAGMAAATKAMDVVMMAV